MCLCERESVLERMFVSETDSENVCVCVFVWEREWEIECVQKEWELWGGYYRKCNASNGRSNQDVDGEVNFSSVPNHLFHFQFSFFVFFFQLEEEEETKLYMDNGAYILDAYCLTCVCVRVCVRGGVHVLSERKGVWGSEKRFNMKS